MTSDAQTSASIASMNFATIYRNHIYKLASAADDAATGLRTLFLYLRAQNPELDYIEIQYDGCGDSGNVDSIFYGGKKTSDSLTPFSVQISDDQPLPDEVAQGRTHQPGEFQRGVGWVTTGDPVNLSAEQLLSDLGWDLAYGKNPGFETNEGGYGSIVIAADKEDPSVVRITLSHSDRMIETTDYEYDL
jgi:hypothetical protein